MRNYLIQKKMIGFVRYAGVLLLVLGMALLMRMDVNAEMTELQVNTPYFVEDLAGKDFNFTIPSPGRFRFCFEHCVNPENIKVKKYDSGNFPDYWETGLENRSSNWFTIGSGNHSAKIKKATVNSEATFTVQYEPAGSYVGEVEPNDTINSAFEIELNKQYWGSCRLYGYGGYDYDYYHFTLSKPSKVDFSFNKNWKVPDPVLYCEDQKGNIKKLGKLGPMRLEAGSYYIMVLIYSDEYIPPEYTFMVSAAEEAASEYEIEKNNLQDQANEKEVNRDYTGNINQYGTDSGESADIDWFKFVIPKKSYLKLELTVPRQAGGSVTAKLYKDSQEILNLVSGSNPYIESEEKILPEGTYYIRMSGNANWDYKIRLSQREFIGVTGIELISQKVLKSGESTVLSAVVKPDNASEKAVNWSSSDERVASVDQTGKVTAKNSGTAVITAQAADGNGIKASCTITVLVNVQEIELDSQIFLYEGEIRTISPVIKPDNASNKTLKWSSSDISVATVDQTGKVTANKGGTAVITAEAADGSGIKAVCEVTVLVSVEKIELDSQKTLMKGETEIFSAVVKPDNASEKTLEWSSSDSSVASVNNAGEVKAKKEGKAVITAQATDGSGIEAACKVTILTGVKKIKLVSQKTLGVGGNTVLSAVVKPDSASEKTIKWSSSNKNVASVDQAGKVRAKKKGTAVITARATDGSEVEATCRITVQAGVKSIRLPAEKTMKSRETMTLSAVVKPNKAFNKKLNWSSSNTQVATVDKNGKVKALKSGKTVITAQAADGNAVKASCKLTVTMGTAEAKEIYSEYYYDNFMYNSEYPYSSYDFYDINQDGIPEMFVRYELGINGLCDVYTLVGSKIKLVEDRLSARTIFYNTSKKQICMEGSGGASLSYETFYKMEGGKLKKITEYKIEYKETSGKSVVEYYKDGKKISVSKGSAVLKDLDKWPYLKFSY